MIRLGILFGGRSPEHEISCLSAVSVISAVDMSRYETVLIGITAEGRWLLYDGPADNIKDGSWQKYAEDALENDPGKYGFAVMGSLGADVKTLSDMVDFVLPVVHGTYCEDGRLQGLLEMASIPYGGCGVTASAAAMDKIIAKKIFEEAGLPVCKYTVTYREETERDIEGAAARIEKELPYPLCVKPANNGSSVGISMAADRSELVEGLRLAAAYDRRILVEEALDCREIEVAVLGNYEVSSSVPGEITATEGFYDYDAKYVDDGRPKMRIPAEIPAETADILRDYAVKAFKAIDGAGFSRCDFFIDKRDGSIYINEINTIPGFTEFSMFPLLWEETGQSYAKTVERIIELGYERYNDENNRTAHKSER